MYQQSLNHVKVFRKKKFGFETPKMFRGKIAQKLYELCMNNVLQ